jgi:hypothetical protein
VQEIRAQEEQVIVFMRYDIENRTIATTCRVRLSGGKNGQGQQAHYHYSHPAHQKPTRQPDRAALACNGRYFPANTGGVIP